MTNKQSLYLECLLSLLILLAIHSAIIYLIVFFLNKSIFISLILLLFGIYLNRKLLFIKLFKQFTYNLIEDAKENKVAITTGRK
mgnify:CR=1 FL=1